MAACHGSAPAQKATHDAGTDARGRADAPVCVEPAYPAGPYGTTVGSTLADRTWSGVSASGKAGSVSLHDALAGCPDDPPVLVVRVDAAWCGTCQSYAAHGKTLLRSDVGGKVRLFDVVFRDQDNAPASSADGPAWQAIEDERTLVAVDPDFSVQDLVPASTELPVMLVVDARAMILRSVLSNPTEDQLEYAVASAWAAVDGQPAPDQPAPVLTDGRFTRDQWDLVSQMVLTDPPAPDPSNAYADSIAAAALGGKLFTDMRLSPSGTVDCTSCHRTARQLTDGDPTSSNGMSRITRNSPSLTFAAYDRWQDWDGRADSLWSQALGPMEASAYMASSRLFVAHAIASYYTPEYQAVFGPLPPLSDTTRFPPSGMPGDAAYDGMAAADQEAVTRVFVNAGKAIEAYERSLRGTAATLDAYASGSTSALTDAQKDGLLAFLQAGCAQCHYGPRLTDDAFHVLRFPTGDLQAGPDPGRQAGIPELVASAFDLGSSWSDDPSLARPAPAAGAWTLGAFKTPQLRNVSLTAPYGHGGNYSSLSDVVELIRNGGLDAGSPLTEGTTEPWLVRFDAGSDTPIVNFLDSLSMELPH